jgi:glutamine synthetase
MIITKQKKYQITKPTNYIWIDINGDIRYKVKFDNKIKKWSYDGSSVGLCDTKNSDRDLIPIYTSSNKKENYVVCIDSMDLNEYINIFKIGNKFKIGFEQEFFVCSSSYNDSYCRPYSNNIQEVICDINNTVNLYGFNTEVAENQYEIQLEANTLLNSICDLIIARFLLLRKIDRVSFKPKPFKDLNGSGLHINISYKGIENSYLKFLQNLQKTHSEFIKNTGYKNRERLTGAHETSNYNVFKYGISDRTASIRLIKDTNGKIERVEDRRPGSDTNPFHIACFYIDAYNKL